MWREAGEELEQEDPWAWRAKEIRLQMLSDRFWGRGPQESLPAFIRRYRAVKNRRQELLNQLHSEQNADEYPSCD